MIIKFPHRDIITEMWLFSERKYKTILYHHRLFIVYSHFLCRFNLEVKKNKISHACYVIHIFNQRELIRSIPRYVIYPVREVQTDRQTDRSNCRVTTRRQNKLSGRDHWAWTLISPWSPALIVPRPSSLAARPARSPPPRPTNLSQNTPNLSQNTPNYFHHPESYARAT